MAQQFLTAATAFEDFHNQTHIVIGKSKNILDQFTDIKRILHALLFKRSVIY